MATTIHLFKAVVRLQLINVCSQPCSRWTPQPTDLREHIIGCNSVCFTGIVLNNAVVIAESG